MNYEELSDVGVNHCVSAELFKEDKFSKKQWNNNAQRTFKEIMDGRCVYKSAHYCNNPSDAWPVIIANGISLVYMGGDWEAHALSEFGDEAHNTTHKNPLRASMICFLKMRNEA